MHSRVGDTDGRLCDTCDSASGDAAAVSPCAVSRQSAAGPSTSARAPGVACGRDDLTFQGVPYQYGGTTPATGFDCSGFVQYVLGRHEIALPRTAAEQFRIGQRIGERDLQAGDLVFFSTIAPGASHVGLALSADEFVHAPATAGVVRVERLRSSYWKQRFVGARRLFSE